MTVHLLGGRVFKHRRKELRKKIETGKRNENSGMKQPLGEETR